MFNLPLNVQDVREANVSGDWRISVLRELDEIAISIEEVTKAVKEMKSGKAEVKMDFQWNV